MKTLKGERMAKKHQAEPIEIAPAVHAKMAEELAELRRALWSLISAGKAVYPSLVTSSEKRSMFLSAMVEAERRLIQ